MSGNAGRKGVHAVLGKSRRKTRPSAQLGEAVPGEHLWTVVAAPLTLRGISACAAPG